MAAPSRFLALEDDPSDCILLKRRLLAEWPGCEVVEVATEKDFTRVLKRGGIDLIISDYWLPGFHGLDALKLARTLRPDVPVLFFSGVMGDDVAVESLKAGATDYVLKDRPARLVPAIRRALQEAAESARRTEVDAKLRSSTQALTDAIRTHQALVNSVDGIVWQAELPSLRFTFVSQQAERLLGYPARRWLEEPNFWQDHIFSEDSARALELCRELNNENQHRTFEYRMVAADGRLVWLRDMVSVRAEKDGSVRIQGIMVDCSRTKAAEQARVQSERVKAAMQQELKKSNESLVRKNEEIQNFYHTLSHELKTPLTSAREFVSIVIDGLAGPLVPRQLEYLEIARDSCDQLRACINDLLDATLIETGKVKMDIKPAPLAPLLHKVTLAMGRTAEVKGIEIVEQLQPGLPDVAIDEHRMIQVVSNLFTNALKYTSAGGTIVLKAGVVPNRPELVRVSVADNGCGIPKKEQERIFEHLYQIKSGDAATEKGIGLGLYLCREFVELHGGTISVESEPGKGSTFAFVLPTTRESIKTNVLIVDDDAELIEILPRIFDAEHFNVHTARNGFEALEQMRREPADIVLLDLIMPGFNGSSTLKAIRQDWPSVPVIIHTALSDGEVMKDALVCSPFTLLAKPSSPTQILETVRKVQRAADTAIWQRHHFGLQKPAIH
ncbi:MAG TPA: response regulator [Candidatus Dormibacteraeota bacterium]|nr:response regulator [Candidatus Dormibacteraeota bacterium]